MIYVTRDKKICPQGCELHQMWVGEKPRYKDGYWNRLDANGFRWWIGGEEAAKALGIHLEPGEIKEYDLVERKP